MQQSFSEFLGLRPSSSNDSLCALSLKERAIGFCVCVGAGFVLSFLSIFRLADPFRFAALFTLGNILSLSASAFLCGVERQWKRMFAKTRRTIACVYIASMAATLGVALGLGRRYWPLVLVLVGVQFCAMVYYGMSFVPYGRAMTKTVIVNVLSPRRSLRIL